VGDRVLASGNIFDKSLRAIDDSVWEDVVASGLAVGLERLDVGECDVASEAIDFERLLGGRRNAGGLKKHFQEVLDQQYIRSAVDAPWSH
jgi:hypothetical protein